MCPHAFQTGERIFKLSQFDRQSSFVRLSLRSKDIENQFGPVNNFYIEGFFKIPGLRWIQVIVEQDNVGVLHFNKAEQLHHFPLAEISSLVWVLSALNNTADYSCTGRRCQTLEFIKWVLGRDVFRQYQTGQNTSFACQTFRAIMRMQRDAYSCK